ncbi:MAG: Flp pilus assembly complex ATPase component TadA [Parcubacteria group bacterium]|nr:Flp pilus assembly complex ATPase component TadA [Parcubacteria group bacterium]
MKEILNDNKIKDILLKGDYISEKDIEQAEKSAKQDKLSLSDYLLKNNLITKDLLGQAIAESFQAEYADLNSYEPTKEQVLKIPEVIAKKYRLVLFKENKDGVIITTDNPKQKGISEIVSKALKTKKIKLAYSLSEDIEIALGHYRKTLEARFIKIIKSQGKIAPEIIKEIINDALSFRASDVHFEPREKETIVRLRIDGVLQEVGRIPKDYYENILNRIKVQANLRIDEHYSAQDGAIRFDKEGSIVDMRVSVVPTVEGEKVAIRLLAQYIKGMNLSDLGLSKQDQELVDKVARNPFGMILVTGPTGSGKTTTLYAILKTLNRPEVNVTTIEDPVEYKIAEANQIQVNKKTNLSFAQGLRAIVRQDPDIILVGEIRDQETAEIAVNAALTGHLLLSTFHANNAATAVPRLLDMGIEPFLLSSTLEIVVAQRLARRLCESCRYGYSEKIFNLEKLIPAAKKYFKEQTVTLYKSKGCSSCGGLGYKGRLGIFEIIKITQEMKDLILKNPSSGEIWDLAKKQGARSLFDDGIGKVKNGITSLEELLRVVSAE